MWLLLVRRDSVVLGDLAMHAEEHRLLFSRQVRPPNLACDRLYFHP